VNSVFKTYIRVFRIINYFFLCMSYMRVRAYNLTFIFECSSVHLGSDMCPPEITQALLFSWQTEVNSVLCSEVTEITV